MQAFVPPLGDFLVILRDGEPINGGAFMSHDDETAELKRIWTHPDLGRQGIARRVVEALEISAASLGYRNHDHISEPAHSQPPGKKPFQAAVLFNV